MRGRVDMIAYLLPFLAGWPQTCLVCEHQGARFMFYTSVHMLYSNCWQAFFIETNPDIKHISALNLLHGDGEMTL